MICKDISREENHFLIHLLILVFNGPQFLEYFNWDRICLYSKFGSKVINNIRYWINYKYVYREGSTIPLFILTQLSWNFQGTSSNLRNTYIPNIIDIDWMITYSDIYRENKKWHFVFCQSLVFSNCSSFLLIGLKLQIWQSVSYGIIFSSIIAKLIMFNLKWKLQIEFWKNDFCNKKQSMTTVFGYTCVILNQNKINSFWLTDKMTDSKVSQILEFSKFYST